MERNVFITALIMLIVTYIGVYYDDKSVAIVGMCGVFLCHAYFVFNTIKINHPRDNAINI
jgi:hypothetical protein